MSVFTVSLQYFYLIRCLGLHGVLPENGQDLLAGHLVTDLNLPQRERLLLRIILYIDHNQQFTGQQEMNFDLRVSDVQEVCFHHCPEGGIG